MLDERDPQHFDPDESIGEIIGKIVTDGRELAEAELDLIKAKAISEAMGYKVPALLFAGAFLFAMGAMIALFWGIAAALATLIGPLGGGLAGAAIALLAAGLLAMVAKSKLEALK